MWSTWKILKDLPVLSQNGRFQEEMGEWINVENHVEFGFTWKAISVITYNAGKIMITIFQDRKGNLIWTLKQNW